MAAEKLDKGLVVADFKLGDGPEANTGDTVLVHCGALKDGTNSTPRWPARARWCSRSAGPRAIKGWDLGIVGMKVGGLRKLIVPAELAYGGRRGEGIPRQLRPHLHRRAYGREARRHAGHAGHAERHARHAEHHARHAERRARRRPGGRRSRRRARHAEHHAGTTTGDSKPAGEAKPGDSKPADGKAGDVKAGDVEATNPKKAG